MKRGEEVYFFDSKRSLRTGVIVRHNKGVYVINDGRRLFRRRITQIGRKENGIGKNKTNKAGMER